MCEEQTPSQPELPQYAGRWVALLGDRVIGVGETEDDAYQSAKGSRPREEPTALTYVGGDSYADTVISVAAASRFTDDLLAGQVRRILLDADLAAFLVGGGVRDCLIGRCSHDLDFVVLGDGIAAGRRVADQLNGSFYPLDSERGVSRVIVHEADRTAPTIVDIASAQGGSIEADLAGRDFTVNAMAIDLTDLQLLDLHGGREDLRGRRLRLVSPDAIERDPIRALRAVRQASELGFLLAPDTAAQIERDGERLACVSPERVRDELLSMLAQPDAATPFQRLSQLGLLQWTVPELVALQDEAQTAPHHLNVWEHSLLTVTRFEELLRYLLVEDGSLAARRAGDDRWPPSLHRYRHSLRQHLCRSMPGGHPRWLLCKLAALVHDVGKPACRQVDDAGRARFIGHEQRGSELAAAMTQRLHLSRAGQGAISRMVKAHMRPLLLSYESGVTRRAAHRFHRDAGDASLDVVLLAMADHLALKPGREPAAGWQPLVDAVNILLDYRLADDSPFSLAPLVTGHDLISDGGLSPGPEVGCWLRRIREEQISGSLLSRMDALNWLAKALGRRTGVSR